MQVPKSWGLEEVLPGESESVQVASGSLEVSLQSCAASRGYAAHDATLGLKLQPRRRACDVDSGLSIGGTRLNEST
jgi:hypothetical protein